MENSKLVTSKEITKDIIGNFLLWELILEFCYVIVFRLITKKIESNLFIMCISIFLQIIVTIFVWKITLAKSFKKKVILYKDIPSIMKNLFIFIIVICVIMVIYSFSNINSIINESIEDNKNLQFLDSFVNNINIESITSKYLEQKQNAIESVKNEIYKYLIIFNICFVTINLIILPFQRRKLLNYVAIEEDNIN